MNFESLLDSYLVLLLNILPLADIGAKESSIFQADIAPSLSFWMVKRFPRYCELSSPLDYHSEEELKEDRSAGTRSGFGYSPISLSWKGVESCSDDNSEGAVISGGWWPISESWKALSFDF